MNRPFLISLLALLAVTLSSGPVLAEDSEKKEPERGLLVNQPGTSPGYTLIAPFSTGLSYLLDIDGQVVHTWKSRYRPGLAPYLLPNGNLLRGIQIELESRFGAGGISGGIQEFSPDGDLLWEFHLADDRFYHHHDIEPLPNGNFLMVSWEHKTKEEVLAAGRRPTHVGDGGLWSEVVLEIQPLRPIGARVVWEWHVWDHLIQDTDPELPNYGVVADHPERVDINGDIPDEKDEKKAGDDSAISAEERAQLIALGYLDADADADSGEDKDEEKKTKAQKEREKRERERMDWLHINGIDYNVELDQIVTSSWEMNEIWIIDHGTSTKEATGSTGGKRGRGGDLLFRWGNPQTYDRGTEEDRRLFHQHDPQWVPSGYPGAGHITIYNNGRKRPEEEYSSVVEIRTPLRKDGTYEIEKGAAYGPAEPAWEYAGEKDHRFYSSFISGAHRLQNGNTLVCSGAKGRVFEVTPDGKILWDFHNDFGDATKDGVPNQFTYAMFRATRIAADHPGLKALDLSPLDPQPKTGPEMLAELPEPGEKPTGWEELFDEEKAGAFWTAVNTPEGGTFRIGDDPEQDGQKIILCSGVPEGFIRSTRMVENFIVDFEWRLPEEKTEAGFMIWADPLPEVGGAFPAGKILRMSTPDGEDEKLNGAGEWNHYRVTAIDGVVQLEANGKVAFSGESHSPKKGHVAFLSHGHVAHLRNFKLWELPVGARPATESESVPDGQELASLYDGQDLEGWEVIDGDWKPDDRKLVCQGAGEIEVKLPPDVKRLSFDYRRRGKSGADLPFRIGDVAAKNDGEKPGEWNRVVLEIGDGKIRVECGGQRQEYPKGSTSTLRLVSSGASTEFCNLLGGR